MGNAQLIKDVKESIAFFENEVVEFTKAKLVDEEARAKSENRAQWRELTLAIRYDQEFIDEAVQSFAQYRARLKEIQK